MPPPFSCSVLVSSYRRDGSNGRRVIGIHYNRVFFNAYGSLLCTSLDQGEIKKPMCCEQGEEHRDAVGASPAGDKSDVFHTPSQQQHLTDPGREAPQLRPFYRLGTDNLEAVKSRRCGSSTNKGLRTQFSWWKDCRLAQACPQARLAPRLTQAAHLTARASVTLHASGDFCPSELLHDTDSVSVSISWNSHLHPVNSY